MIRLFIAWPLATTVEQELGGIIEQLRKHGGRVSWLGRNNIHLTARFLGDTAEKQLPELKLLIDRVAVHSSTTQLTLDKLGAFPDMKRPRVIWAGLAGDTSPLRSIVDELERGVREIGFAPETKSFKPHLTLGRVKDTNGIEALMSAVQQVRVNAIPVVFDRIVLFKSMLAPKGAMYEKLHERKVGGIDRIEG